MCEHCVPVALAPRVWDVIAAALVSLAATVELEHLAMSKGSPEGIDADGTPIMSLTDGDAVNYIRGAEIAGRAAHHLQQMVMEFGPHFGVSMMHAVDVIRDGTGS